MTIVFSLGDTFWIDTIEIAAVDIAAAASLITNVDVVKGGILLGYIVSGFGSISAHFGAFIRHRDNSVLVIGERVENNAANGIEIVRQNNAGGNQDVGAQVIVLLKRPTG